MFNNKSLCLEFVILDETNTLTQLNETDLYSFLFSIVKQTQYIQFFKQIKYLDKERERERGDDDHNNIKYEICKERDSCKLYVFTMQHEMKNFKNN